MKLGGQPGVCRGSVSGPMMGDLRIALRTGPLSVASLGRVTHAPGLHPVQCDDARSTITSVQGGAWVRWSWEYPPSFPELFKAVVGGRRNFLIGAGAGVACGSLGYGRPCDHLRQVPLHS